MRPLNELTTTEWRRDAWNGDFRGHLVRREEMCLRSQQRSRKGKENRKSGDKRCTEGREDGTIGMSFSLASGRWQLVIGRRTYP